MNIVVWTSIITVISVALLAAATYLIDKNAERRDRGDE
jgi:hypothetical protein